MRYLLGLIFLFVTTTSYCYNIIWYKYRYDATLILAKYGINAFLNEIKKSEPYIYPNVLYDTINCASLDQFDADQLLPKSISYRQALGLLMKQI